MKKIPIFGLDCDPLAFVNILENNELEFVYVCKDYTLVNDEKKERADIYQTLHTPITLDHLEKIVKAEIPFNYAFKEYLPIYSVGKIGTRVFPKEEETYESIQDLIPSKDFYLSGLVPNYFDAFEQVNKIKELIS